jgi:hypothetical protein
MAAIWDALVADPRAARERKGRGHSGLFDRWRGVHTAVAAAGYPTKPTPLHTHHPPPPKKQTVDSHFDAFVADALKEAGGRTWRGRQAALAEIASLLQGGRRWDQLGPHLAPIWGMALRGMDDVKESVRRTAALTARCARPGGAREDLQDSSPCCVALPPSVFIPRSTNAYKPQPQTNNRKGRCAARACG